jgi:hypothetical protein
MNLSIKPICERRFMRKNGTSLIYIQYCYSPEKRTLLNTGLAIPPEFWNRKRSTVSEKLPSVYGDPNEINNSLRQMIRSAEDLINYGIKRNISNIGDFVKRSFMPTIDISSFERNCNIGSQDNLNIYYQIEDYIRSKEKKVCKDMPRIYRNMMEHLRAFEEFRAKPITFNCFDLNFYEEFVDFLTYDYVQRRSKLQTVGLKVNTVGKTIN